MAKQTTPGKKAAFPQEMQPMLATLVDQPFDGDEWLFEIKWDGYRAVSLIDGDKTDILSRNSKSFKEKYYPLYDELKKWPFKAVVDGEIIVADRKGISDFSKLQNWRSEADGELLYYVFDLLWYEGNDLTDVPLSQRKQLLEKILPQGERVRYSEAIEQSGIDFFHSAEKMGLEGIIAKKKSSAYSPGNRSKEWLKIKTELRQEVVIGGYTVNEGTPKPFSSLLVGVFEGKKLQYTGKIGTGFNKKMQDELVKLFKPRVIINTPFAVEPNVNEASRFRPNPPKANAVWLKPELVCEVAYREMTNDGVMRHPSFKGLRTDKEAKMVILEKEETVGDVVDPNKSEEEKPGKAGKMITPKKSARATLLNPNEETQVKKIKGKELKFTNTKKIFWPKEGVTKGDMINYYYRVAEYILPYLKDRPQSLNRYPNGIEGKSFYQKNVTGKVPDWVKLYPYVSEGEHKNFMLCNDEATLLYMVNLGCIELNPWSSTTAKPDHPDWCIIDLDPDKNTFDQVVEAANVTRRILEHAGIESYPKTSGSTGLHIYIPLGAKYTYEESKEFARVIARLVQAEIPDFTSIERQISDRGGKMYIDFLQNRPQATLASAYSLRPKPGATVSMPLHWEEVKKGLKMTDFTIFNALDRLKETGDIFKPVLGKGIDMEKALEKLADLI